MPTPSKPKNPNEPTPETLAQIEELGSLMFTAEEAALVHNLEPRQLINPDTRLGRAYNRGVLKSVAEVRKSIYKMARDGSTPAQKQMVEFLERLNTANHALSNRPKIKIKQLRRE